MIFKSYTDIENSYNNKFIKKIRENNLDDPSIRYVCEVKIDGSNYQCSIDSEDNFITGSRTQILDNYADFQGASLRVLRAQKIEEKLRNLKELIKERIKNITEVAENKFTLTVYGELCGGMYTHPAVEKVSGAKKVQGRVSYHADNVWIPFDVILRDESGKHLYTFSSYEAKNILNEVDLPYTLIVFEGTFDECLNYKNDFIDMIGVFLFNLPVIENNITEGVVIKPIIPNWIGNERVILKNKNDKFKEKQHVKQNKEPKAEIKLNELELKYFNIMREYMTESRLYSVFSKVDTSTLNEKMFGMILGMFVKDLFKDFDIDFSEEVKKLEMELNIDEFNIANARKLISKEVTEFIRPTFLEHLRN